LPAVCLCVKTNRRTRHAHHLPPLPSTTTQQQRNPTPPQPAQQTDATATSQQLTPLPLLLPLSARSEEALKNLAASYGELLVGKKDGKANALSYDRSLEVCLEAGTRRTHHHGFRLAATGRSAPELKASIAEALEEGVLKPVTQVGEWVGFGVWLVRLVVGGWNGVMYTHT
jgi:acyl transferase domain-containing protein